MISKESVVFPSFYVVSNIWCS
ncbi:hypothetical protein OIU76_002003, partial [Salix suchowensis]